MTSGCWASRMARSCTHAQMFWEAFPAHGGTARTTYMFAYADADSGRPSFEQLLDTYFAQLPEYQGLSLSQLRFKVRPVLRGRLQCGRGRGPSEERQRPAQRSPMRRHGLRRTPFHFPSPPSCLFSVQRVLFGGFPSYSDGPLAPAFDRVLQIGDASACQSPLRFAVGRAVGGKDGRPPPGPGGRKRMRARTKKGEMPTGSCARVRPGTALRLYSGATC